MRTQKSQIAIQDGRLKTVPVELPIIQQGQNFLIDAQLLYQSLKCKTRFNDWISYRIREYSFQEGIDYFTEKSVKSGVGRKGSNYHITLDMAKELAMLERNEIGRTVRRYFIQKEKEARGLAMLPKESELFKGLKPERINGRRLWHYGEILKRVGYSANAGSANNRKHRYPGHFVQVGHALYITEEFAMQLLNQKRVTDNRGVLRAMQPVLEFGPLTPKGGLEKGGHKL